jgi:hypothetical protein
MLQSTSYNFSDIVTDAGDSITIPNAEKCSWTTSNNKIAYMRDNILYAQRVGTATLASKNNSFNVTVRAKSNLYNEPCLNFGSSPNSVKTWMNDNNKLAEFGTETDGILIYYCNSNVIREYTYFFHSF